MKNKMIFKFTNILILAGIIVAFFINTDYVRADEGDYLIRVNMKMNCLTVYEKGEDGEYSVPVKAMACSAFESDFVDETTYTIINKAEWKKMLDGSYSKYVLNISNEIAICTTPYTNQSNDSLDKEKFNRLGDEKSEQNIWLCSADAKWLYENCMNGATVVLYNDETVEGPLGKPYTIKVSLTGNDSNWDPTDDDARNPWRSKSAKITGVRNYDVYIGDEINLLENVRGYDICGNDITENIILMGSYDFNKEGLYSITYYLKDAAGSQTNESATLNVRKKQVVASSGNVDVIASASQLESEKTNTEKLKILIWIGIAALIVSYGIVRYTKKQ